MDLEKEFAFFRDRLKNIAQLHVYSGNEKEVAFLIGCLHSIAHENSTKFKLTGELNERTEK